LLSVQQVVIQDKHSFEVYGYDLLFDSDLKPWLIEVNASPSLTGDVASDYDMKKNVLQDTFDVLDIEGNGTSDGVDKVGGYDLIWHNGPVQSEQRCVHPHAMHHTPCTTRHAPHAMHHTPCTTRHVTKLYSGYRACVTTLQNLLLHLLGLPQRWDIEKPGACPTKEAIDCRYDGKGWRGSSAVNAGRYFLHLKIWQGRPHEDTSPAGSAFRQFIPARAKC
jgi:hypothetical protein